MASRLVYSAGRHTYSLDGERVPSVTGVIGKATGKPALVNWAARLAAEWAADHVDDLATLGTASWVREATGASNRARDAAARNGTLLHELATRLLYGDPLPAEDSDGLPYPDDVMRTAEQMARFMDAWNVDPVVYEAAVFHEDDRWAGRLDLVADMGRENERWLLDWKTGTSGVWPETSLQLAAYRHATHIQLGDRDMLMAPVMHTAAVWVRPDGWELLPVRADASVYDVFRHMLPVAAWASQRREDSVAAPMPVPA
jgi:hypothetical protein